MVREFSQARVELQESLAVSVMVVPSARLEAEVQKHVLCSARPEAGTRGLKVGCSVCHRHSGFGNQLPFGGMLLDDASS